MNANGQPVQQILSASPVPVQQLLIGVAVRIMYPA
jgi:hypothetical protein